MDSLLFLLPKVLKVPVTGSVSCCGLAVCPAAVAAPGRGCVSLDSALGPAARCSCAARRPRPPFIPEVGRKSVTSWLSPTHFLALEV